MDFFKWIEEQQLDVRCDCYPIQYKFEDDKEKTFDKIYQFIQKIKHFNNIFSKEDIIQLYENEKNNKLINPQDLIHLVLLEIVQIQFKYISKIVEEEKVPLQVGVNAFQTLSDTMFNPFNASILKTLIRVHYKTLVRFRGILSAFYTCFYTKGVFPNEYELVHSLSKNYDEKIFSSFLNK